MDFPQRILDLMRMLPQEIQMNIMTLLPIKSIGRFRCVSKTWRKLLSEPGFIRVHLDRNKHSTENEMLVLVSGNGQSYTVYTARIDCELPGEITFLATELAFVMKLQSPSGFFPSCDGLIILQDNGKLSLINLTTKEVRELPAPSHALDSFKKLATSGLGYDHVNDDYKVVSPSSYFNEDNKLTTVFHVYSVRSGTWKEVDTALYEWCAVRNSTWKKVESFKYELGCSMSSTGVVVGGSIHWFATNTSNHSSFIVGFNLAEEKLLIIPAPTSVYGKSLMYNSMSELGGCLCLFGEVTNIWAMKEYGVQLSWTKFSIGNGISSYEPELCIPGRWEVTVRKDYQTEDEEWLMYYVDSATFKRITVRPWVTEPNFIGSFRETLMSPYYKYDARSCRS